MRTSFGELRRRLPSPSPSFRSRVSKTLLGALTAAIVAAGGSALVAQQTGSGVLPIAASFAGGGAFTGQLSGPVGNCATAPPYSFFGRTTTGLCSPAVDSWALIAGGVTTLTGTSTAVQSAVPLQVTSASNSYFTGGGNVGIGTMSPIANTLQLGDTNTFGWSDASLSRGAADRMDAGANDSWYVPGGGLGVGVLPPAAGIIKSSGEIQPGTSLQVPAAEFVYWAGRALISSPANGQSNFSTSTGLAGIGLDFGIDGMLKIRNRAQTADASATLANLTYSGTLTPASGTTIIGGTAIISSSITSPSPTAGIGYATGAGGAVTQLTSRTTGVTLNTVNGEITLVSAAGSTTAASFTVTNSVMVATDHVELNQKSGANKYVLLTTAKAAGSFEITVYTTGGTATEAPVISFAIVKGSAS